MRRVATELQVEAMSLYNHVANKRDLLVGVIDRVLETVTPLRVDDPVDQAKQLARAARRSILEHPRAAPLLATNTTLGDSSAVRRIRETSLSIGDSLGLGRETSIHAFAVVLSFVIGHILLETAEFPASDPPPEDALPFDPDLSFELGLEALLAGLASGRTVPAGVSAET